MSFDDVLSGNAEFVRNFSDENLTGTALRGLAIVTCMDSRINPLAAVGMRPGDVKIIRNAGARVTDDVLRTLVLATYLLGVDRVLVLAHTDCKMASANEAQIHEEISRRHGVDTRSVEIRTISEPKAALSLDVIRIQTHPLLRDRLEVMGAVYDVSTGRISPN